MRPLTPDDRERYRREQAEREYERSLSRLADLDVAGSRRAARTRRFGLIWRIALISAATLATLGLMRATEAVAQVPTDRLDQAARCGIYLFLVDPDADGDLVAQSVLEGLSAKQGAAVALRISEMTRNLTSLEDSDQLRAYREIQSTWRPNCVAIGLLGGGK